MLTDDLRNQMTPPLDMLRVVSQALRLAWQRRNDVVRLVVVSAIGQIMVGIVSGRLGVEHLRYQIPLALLQMVLITSLAVAVHRVLLLGQGAVPASHGFGFSPWTPRETRYFGWSLALLVIAIILLRLPVRVLEHGLDRGFPDPGGLLSSFSEPFFAVVGVYVVSRLSLILPGMAIDQHHNFRWAWELSRGQGWRLLVVVGLLPGVFLWWARAFIERGQSMLVNGLVYTAWVAVLVVTVATLSSAYQTLTQPVNLMLAR
jgi:hypothetical protein